MFYKTCPLELVRVHWTSFAQTQEVWNEKQYISQLEAYAKKGAKVTFAREGSRIAGTMMFLPALSLENVANTSGLASAVEGLGFEPDRIAIQTNIFVAPEYRGKGLSVDLDKRSRAAAQEDGYTHFLGIFYETPEIKHWWLRDEDTIFTGLHDDHDDPVHLLPL